MFLMAVAEKDEVLEGIVDDIVKVFRSSSESEKLQRILIYGGDEKSREYVCDKLREKMAEDLREVVSGDSFEKMPDTYAFELEYFLKIARAQAIP